ISSSVDAVASTLVLEKLPENLHSRPSTFRLNATEPCGNTPKSTGPATVWPSGSNISIVTSMPLYSGVADCAAAEAVSSQDATVLHWARPQLGRRDGGGQTQNQCSDQRDQSVRAHGHVLLCRNAANIDVAVVGDEAVVIYTRTDEFTDARTGHPMRASVRLTKVLRREAGGWKLAQAK